MTIQPEARRPIRTERESKSKFGALPRDVVRDHTEESDGAEHDGKKRKRTKRGGQHAACRHAR